MDKVRWDNGCGEVVRLEYAQAHTPPDSIDLQFMSHCVMDRICLVALLNRPSSFVFLSIVTQQMDRAFFVAGQYEDRIPMYNCYTSQIRHLELDRCLPFRI